MNAGVYKIEVGNATYFGRSTNLIKRRSRHKKELMVGKHSNSYLQKSFNKYKEFKFTVLFLLSEIELQVIIEQVLITCYPCCNIKSASEGGATRNGMKNSATHIAAIAKASRSRVRTFEEKERLRNLRRGVPLSEETKRKMSESRRGCNSGSRDTKIYTWYNIHTGEKVEMTRKQLQKFSGLSTAETYKIVKKGGKAKGWIL